MMKYHTFWPRFCAGFVDGLVFIPLDLVDGYLSAPARGPFVLIVWAVLSYSAYWLYSVLLHARYGQTLGKMATRIRVLDLSEERIPSLRQAFIRDVGYILLNTFSLAWFVYLVIAGRYSGVADVPTGPGMFLSFASLGWFLLEVITMLTNNKRRAFHDFIAGTVVVRNEA
ncbi:MAG: RDD family protein [Chthoniobacter sp.]